jgi:TPR repeat protein
LARLLYSIRLGSKDGWDELLELAHQRNLLALVMVAYCYSSEEIYAVPCQQPHISSKAFKWLKRNALQDCALSMYLLGECYVYGIHVPDDFSAADYWLRLSTEKGYFPARCSLGNLYKKKGNTFIHWYQLAAGVGDPVGEYYLGKCYWLGSGVKEDPAKALRLVLSAAKNGCAIAKYDLARWYDSGTAVTAKHSRKIRSYRKAASRYVPLCCENDVVKLFVEAHPCYTFATPEVEFSVSTQFRLGRCYEGGVGVNKNVKEAARWYRLAADRGHVPALINLGKCYGNGIKVLKNIEEVHDWYQAVAQCLLPT